MGYKLPQFGGNLVELQSIVLLFQADQLKKPRVRQMGVRNPSLFRRIVINIPWIMKTKPRPLNGAARIDICLC